MVIDTILVGDRPTGAAINPAGTRLYVTNFSDDTVSVANITADANTALPSPQSPIDVGDGPSGLSVHPDGTRLYVANRNEHTVSVIDIANDNNTEEAADRIPVGTNPVALGQFIGP